MYESLTVIPTLCSIINAASFSPSIRIILGSMLLTNSWALLGKSEVVMKTPEVMYFVYGYGIFISFGLYVDRVESEFVFVYDAVYSAVSAFSDRASGFFSRSSISHGDEEVDDEFFKESGR